MSGLTRARLTLFVIDQVERRDKTCVIPGCDVATGLHRFFIRRPDGRDYTRADLVLVCGPHLRAIKDRKIGIAGDGDKPSITDATAALDFGKGPERHE